MSAHQGRSSNASSRTGEATADGADAHQGSGLRASRRNAADQVGRSLRAWNGGDESHDEEQERQTQSAPARSNTALVMERLHRLVKRKPSERAEAEETTNVLRSPVSVSATSPADILPSKTSQGVERKNTQDWRRLRDLWDTTGCGDALSPANRALIAQGKVPLVDDAWIRYFPGDVSMKGQKISMHHIGGSPLTIPLPKDRHKDAHMPGGFRHNKGGPGMTG